MAYMYKAGVSEADPSKITLSIWVGMTSAAIAAAGSSLVPIFEFGTSTDPLTLTSTGRVEIDGMEVSFTWSYGNFTSGYDVAFVVNCTIDNVSVTPGNVPAGASNPGSDHFDGGFYPSADISSTVLHGFMVDNVAGSPGPTSRTLGVDLGSPSGYTWSGIPLTASLTGFSTGGGGFGDFFNSATWTYSFSGGGAPAGFVDFDEDSSTPGALPSSLLLDPSSGSLIFKSCSPIQTATGDPRGSYTKHSTFETSNSVFLPDVWNHIFMNLDLSGGYPFSCSMLVNKADALLSVSDDMDELTFGRNGPYQMALSGKQIGIPIIPADFTRQNASGPNRKVNLSEVQCWMGQAISTANIGMFIDGENKPVDPATPAAAFGTQSVLLRRDKKKNFNFSDNKGTLGSFTVVGTAPKDFTPGPGE